MSKITADHLARRACIYIRQSTPDQVYNNLESQRLQYALVNRAKQLGWTEVEVVDDDQGHTGTGSYRAGFERLLADLCDGKVGAVFSTEISRLSRNGRDLHTLMEFCGVVGALLIDTEGIYDPRQINDRLLIGMKGQISEMEVANFRQRSQAALEQKAKRGELIRRPAVGYVRRLDDKLEKDPDQRVRSAIELVFNKFAEFRSARRVCMWLREREIEIPTTTIAGQRTVVWKKPGYHSLLSMLKNPIYAGAYAFGRSRTAVRIEQGRKRIVRQWHLKQDQWAVLIRDHHDGYISWDVYQNNQETLANNDNAKGDIVRGSVRRGSALLTGILRCGHCGTKMCAQYPGPNVVRYQCAGQLRAPEASRCVVFGGLRADRLVAEQLLEVLKPLGVQAALQATENPQVGEDARIRHKELALQQASYEAVRAQQQYNAVDPLNRLVAAELERRWNEALNVRANIEEELAALRREQREPISEATREDLLMLGRDVGRLWDHPDSPAEFKKHILRTLLKDIIATSAGDTIRLVLHWQGGCHTELTFEKQRTGRHRYVTAGDTIELIRQLARIQSDSMIASILNRIERRTAHGQSWNAKRVCSTRQHHAIAAYVDGERQARGELTVREAAEILKIPERSVVYLITTKRLPAKQACVKAPWILLKRDLDKYAAHNTERPRERDPNQATLDFQ
jgi:DNA invertase Pin-like site-specific DNA recombinase/cell division protein FtsB